MNSEGVYNIARRKPHSNPFLYCDYYCSHTVYTIIIIYIYIMYFSETDPRVPADGWRSPKISITRARGLFFSLVSAPVRLSSPRITSPSPLTISLFLRGRVQWAQHLYGPRSCNLYTQYYTGGYSYVYPEFSVCINRNLKRLTRLRPIIQ